MDLSKRYRIQDDKTVYRIIDGEAIILSLDSGYYYSLNKTGTRMWEALASPRNLDAILKSIGQEYRIPEEKVRKDFLELMADLEKEKLIAKR